MGRSLYSVCYRLVTAACFSSKNHISDKTVDIYYEYVLI